MKKRVKLLTTIASLCLAVALMAFGVYAANTVAFKTTSTVNFAASGISGSWYFGVYADNGATVAPGANTLAAADTAFADGHIVLTNNGLADDLAAANVIDCPAITLKAEMEGTTTITYRFGFKVSGKIMADLTVVPTLGSETEVDAFSITSTTHTGTTASADAIKEITVTVEVDHTLINFSADGSVTIEFTATAVPHVGE